MIIRSSPGPGGEPQSYLTFSIVCVVMDVICLAWLGCTIPALTLSIKVANYLSIPMHACRYLVTFWYFYVTFFKVKTDPGEKIRKKLDHMVDGH